MQTTTLHPYDGSFELAHLLRSIEKLKQERDAARTAINVNLREASAQIKALVAERDALRKDALRYRYIRDHACPYRFRRATADATDKMVDDAMREDV